MNAINRQQAAAQRVYDNASPEEDPGWESFHEAYVSDPENIRRAADWVDGGMSEAHYTETQIAFYDLHETDPDRLPGSDLLARLYRLAKDRHAAMRAWLDEEAGNAYEAAIEKYAADEAEARDSRRAA